MFAKAVEAKRFVVVSPKTTVLVATFGGPSQMRKFTWLKVEVVVEPV